MTMIMYYYTMLLLASLSGSASPPVCRSSTGMARPIVRTLQFCGSGGHAGFGSPTCCTAEDDLRLHQLFLDNLVANKLRHECSSALKAKICAVCLPWSAPAAEPFSNTSNDDSSSLPLRCAAAAPSVVPIHDLTSATAEPPTSSSEWMVADDDDRAPMTPKWLIGLISVLVITLLGGFVAYFRYSIYCSGARLQWCNNSHCCNNNNCWCLC